MPRQFSFLFQYLRKLKFEERPDYNMIKCLFGELFLSKFDLVKNGTFSFDWFKEDNHDKNEDDRFTLKKIDEKSSLNEINENEEINKLNDSSKVIKDNDEEGLNDKDKESKKDSLYNSDNQEDKKDDNLSKENNKEEIKKEKSSSDSYGLIQSDNHNKNN